MGTEEWAWGEFGVERNCGRVMLVVKHDPDWGMWSLHGEAGSSGVPDDPATAIVFE